MNKRRLLSSLPIGLLLAVALVMPSAGATTTCDLTVQHTVVGHGQIIFANRNACRVDLSVGKRGAAKADQDTSIPAFGFRVIYTQRHRLFWEAYATHLSSDGTLKSYGSGMLFRLQRQVAPGPDQCWNIRRRQPRIPHGMVQTDAGCITRR